MPSYPPMNAQQGQAQAAAPAQAQAQPMQQGAGYQGVPNQGYALLPPQNGQNPFEVKDEWQISYKFCDHLFKLDSGDAPKFIDWRDHITDHLAQTNSVWKSLLTYAKECTEPISFTNLKSVHYGPHDGLVISQRLWNFVIRWLGPNYYRRRLQLAQGMDGNGFELWRRLHADLEGGDVITQNAG